VGFNLSPSPLYYIILGGLIFLTLALSTSMAMVIGVFADDVRGAQAVVGYLILPVMIPSFMVMLGDLQSFPADLQAALLAIPFTYAASFAKMAFVGDFTIGVLGLAYILFWTVVVLYIGSRLFSSEKILTVRFSFGRKKKASSPE
jgi:ABC-2 type transport system permease protein